MSAESTSQNFYRELKKLIPELAKIPNVTRVIVDAQVGELPIVSVEIKSYYSTQEWGPELEPTTRVFRVVPIEDSNKEEP